MTRTDALTKVRWQLMQAAADHQVRLIFALWADGYSLSEITQAVDFSNAWNAKVIAEALQQVEQMIDADAELAVTHRS